MSKSRLVMIGGWGHGAAMLNHLQGGGSNTIELCALGMTSTTETFSDWQKHYACLQGVTVYQDYREMLKEVKADFAVVSTALPNLSGALRDTLQAGLPVYTEKPMTADQSVLTELQTAAANRNLYVMFTTGNHSHPALRKIRELVNAGTLGEIAIVNTRKSYPWADDRPEKFPIKYGGTLGWVGIHALEFIAAATGLDFCKVSAMESNILNPAYAECPDNVAACLELSNGGHATVSLDYHRPRGSRTHGDDWIRVVGTVATIEANLSRNTVLLTGPDGEETDLQMPEHENWFDLIPQALSGNAQQVQRCQALTTEAFRLSKVAIIAQQAAISGGTMAIP